VHIVECREERRCDVGNVVNIALVLHDRILQGFEDPALRHIAEAARLLDADGIVRNPVAVVVDRLAHLEGETVVALNERHAVRDDCILSVGLFVNVDIRDFRELIHEKVALVAQIVCLRTVRLGKHDILVEPRYFLCNAVDLADLDAHLVILCRDLILQLLRPRLDAVDEVVPLRQDCRPRRRIARIVGEVDPRAVKLLHRIENAGLFGIIEDALHFIVVRLIGLIEILRRGLGPILLIGVDIARAVQRDHINAAADVDIPIEGRALLIVRRRGVNALARVPLRRGIRDIVADGIERELIVLDAPHHCIESGKS